MTEETIETNEVEVNTEETTDQESLLAALAPIAMIVGATAGGVYLVRRLLRREDSSTELVLVKNETIDATSSEV